MADCFLPKYEQIFVHLYLHIAIFFQENTFTKSLKYDILV